VGVDGLAKQGDFFEAFVGEFLALAQDVFGIDAAFATAYEGNDAEGAEFVAAALHGDPAADAFLADGREAFVGFFAVFARIDHGRSAVFLGFVEDFGQATVCVGADNKIDVGRAG